VPLVIAALSFAAAVAAHLVWPHRPRAAATVLAWSAGFAAVVCGLAARRADPGPQRVAWTWMTAAVVAVFVGQLYRVVAAPRFPSLADAAYLAAYPLLLGAGAALVRGAGARLVGSELRLDLALLTLITGALVYEFLVRPLAPATASPVALAAAVLWAAGGLTVLAVLVLHVIARRGVPDATAALGLLGVVGLGASGVAYAPLADQGQSGTGPLVLLGWTAGLWFVTAAAAFAPAQAPPARAAPPHSAYLVRLLALLASVAGLAALAVTASLQRTAPELAVITAVGAGLLAGRLVYSLHRDRRYATLLEAEVARQTTTLLDSLSATAAAERELRLVMEAVPDAIMLLDAEGRVLSQNEPAREWTSTSSRGDGGRTVFDLVDAAAAALLREHLRAAFNGNVRRFEVAFVREDRSRVVAAILCAPVREGTKITKVLALARDITDTRRAETQLRQAEKLVAMGQMVSGVAHEINNPAAIISGFAQTLLLDDVKPDHQDMIRTIHDEATRIGRITGNLLAFARMGSKERALVDVNDLVRRTFALRSYYFSTLNITVNLELDPTDPQVWGHGGDLQQLLLNLLINAEHALTTTTGRRVITVRTSTEAEMVRLECEDTGPGMTPEIKQRIFDPFFTTKPEGVGTGLGLSICYGIARDHGGRITVDSEPGRGATFTVVVPRDPRSQSRPAMAGAVQRHGALAVLFVDDEAGIRKAVARYLNRRGMQVRAVADGAEALRLLRTEDFDVIVSDVRMPGVGGRELLEGLRRDRPEMASRLVFSSGDVAAADTAALLRESGVPSILKPFDFAHLEQLIREVAATSSSV
jgi:PAS domain S-box-containing protein